MISLWNSSNYQTNEEHLMDICKSHDIFFSLKLLKTDDHFVFLHA